MIEVREARPDEYETAGQVTYDAYAALPGDHMDDEYGRELRDAARRAREAVVLVAVEKGRVLGCVTYVPDASSPWAEDLREGEAGVRMLAVDPAAQGRGIGRALAAACVDRARAEAKQAVMLHSTPWMEAAHHIYQGLGFRRVPTRDWVPLPKVPLLAFVLDLDGLSAGPR